MTCKKRKVITWGIFTALMLFACFLMINNAAAKESIRAAPDQGLKTKEIEAIIYQARYKKIIRLDEMEMVLKETIYLLLKDGTAYRGLKLPPADFNVDVAKKLHANRWTKWKKKKGRYVLLNSKNNTWNRIPYSDVITQQAFKPGYYHHHKTRNLGLGKSVNRNSIMLRKNGRFETKSFKQVFSGGVDSITITATEDGKGRQSTTTFSSENSGQSNRPNASGKISKRSTDDGADNTGSYNVKDYTIEFRHDSGRVSRRLFLAHKNGIVLGSQKYFHK